MAWVLPWTIVAAVVGAGVWLGVSALGNEVAPRPSAGVQARSPSSPSPVPSATISASGSGAVPSAGVASSRTETPAPATREPRPLITRGITVQVLNATGVTDAGQRMADRLARLGFKIVAVQTAFGLYSSTTVYWSSEATKEAAQRLAEHFGWMSGAKPDNLSSAVSVHVVVGTDET
jgi:LytR cell envelope-related transcriptional attenuator